MCRSATRTHRSVILRRFVSRLVSRAEPGRVGDNSSGMVPSRIEAGDIISASKTGANYRNTKWTGVAPRCMNILTRWMRNLPTAQRIDKPSPESSQEAYPAPSWISQAWGSDVICILVTRDPKLFTRVRLNLTSRTLFFTGIRFIEQQCPWSLGDRFAFTLMWRLRHRVAVGRTRDLRGRGDFRSAALFFTG